MPKFKKGTSGNPAGRKKGSLNPQAKLRRMIDAGALVRSLAAAAAAGDVQAARTLLERCLPPLRSTIEPVTFKMSKGSLSDAGRSILMAIAAGSLAPDTGRELLGALSGLVRVVEVDELTARIEALEKEGGTP